MSNIGIARMLLDEVSGELSGLDTDLSLQAGESLTKELAILHNVSTKHQAILEFLVEKLQQPPTPTVTSRR